MLIKVYIYHEIHKILFEVQELVQRSRLWKILRFGDLRNFEIRKVLILKILNFKKFQNQSSKFFLCSFHEIMDLY